MTKRDYSSGRPVVLSAKTFAALIGALAFTSALAFAATVTLSVNGVHFTAQQIESSPTTTSGDGAWELQEAQRLTNEKIASLDSMSKESATGGASSPEAQSLLEQLRGFLNEMVAGIQSSDWQRVWEGNRQFDNHTGLFWKALDAAQENDRAEDQNNDDSAQSRQDADRQLKDHEKNYANREKELKQNFKRSKVDTTAVRTALDGWKQANANLRSLLSSGDLDAFSDANADITEHYNAVQDAFQALYDGQTYANLEGRFKDAKRQLKNMQGDLKRLGKEVKGTPEYAELQAFVKTYESNLAAAEAQYKTLGSADTETIRDFESDLNETVSTQEFYDKMQDVNELANSAQQRKEAERIIKKEKPRILRDMERVMKQEKAAKKNPELAAAIKDFKTALDGMKAALAAKDYDTVMDLNHDADDASGLFWETLKVVNLGNDVKDIERNDKGLAKQVEAARKEAKKANGRVSAADLPEIEAAAKGFHAAAVEARKAYDSKDTDAALEAVEQAHEHGQTLQDLLGPLKNGGGDGPGGPGDIGDVLQDIDVGLKNIDAAPTKPNAALCRELLIKGRGIVLEFQKSGNEGLMESLQGIGDQVDEKCGEFMPEEN